MPPLRDTVRGSSPTGFEPVENPPNPLVPDTKSPGQALGGNPYLRSTLPPFNASSDTLRQFNESGKTPTRRVIPLPAAVTSGAGGSVTYNTVVSSSSSGSVTPTVAALSVASAAVNVPSLDPSSSWTGTIVLAKAVQLQGLTSTSPLEVRLYADADTQGFDISRASDNAPAFEITGGLITDVIFDTVPYSWSWQNRTAFNPAGTTTYYVTVVNPSTVTATTPAVVTISYLIMEN